MHYAVKSAALNIQIYFEVTKLKVGEGQRTNTVFVIVFITNYYYEDFMC